MAKGKYDDLIDILMEEADIVDEDDSGEGDSIDTGALRSAAAKLKIGNLKFTKAEKDAAKDALDDTGNLYRQGEYSDDVSADEGRRNIEHGQNAWLQAGEAGIIYKAYSKKRKQHYVTVRAHDPNIGKKPTAGISRAR